MRFQFCHFIRNKLNLSDTIVHLNDFVKCTGSAALRREGNAFQLLSMLSYIRRSKDFQKFSKLLTRSARNIEIEIKTGILSLSDCKGFVWHRDFNRDKTSTFSSDANTVKLSKKIQKSSMHFGFNFPMNCSISRHTKRSGVVLTTKIEKYDQISLQNSL